MWSCIWARAYRRLVKLWRREVCFLVFNALEIFLSDTQNRLLLVEIHGSIIGWRQGG